MGNCVVHDDIANHEEFVRNVLDGNIVAHSELDAIILASWKRCRDDFGLDELRDIVVVGRAQAVAMFAVGRGR